MKASKRDLLKVWIVISLCTAGLLSLSSCKENKKPSFIIVAADQLSFNAFSCSEEKSDEVSGLNTLCHESIRFSNAFTTSTQTAAAMGSLLTATYPFQHQLHRSFDRLNPDLPTLPELFKTQKYRTAFWSGKPTILKKTGLSRGFDLFDDISFLLQSSYSISFRRQSDLFFNWVEESSAPFFSVIYSSDLDSINEGEEQISGLEKFDESLGLFFERLKEENLWESNYVIVVGLQGKSEYARLNESVYSNLHSEATRVAMFIKPPRQKGDEGINWKFDSPISLADFGYSLAKTVSPQINITSDPQFPVWSFSALWSSNELDSIPNEPRFLLVEAANTWKKSLELRFSLIFKHYLFIEADTNEFYNRLTDGLETINLISTQNEVTADDLRSLRRIRELSNADKWRTYTGSEYKLSQNNREYWAKPNSRASVFDKEASRLKKNKTTNPLSTLLIYFKNPKQEKDALYEEARRHSYNLSLENIWGLWDPDRQWPQPAVTNANQ
ncbi:sulfatase-like hydrolase/transferase [Pseudobdellovibrio exovorus]|uniref:Sulfatase N-terminal domain-containing protein n=1 Tax=Pseudobdellovibrio exovorus JSS TaxID=1184267 RepID=M4V9Q2_9BACT|nr:sulfatase-like hydrolase/transferase [Pseudobdellovibrio exovorus]AGH94756.1 hypothetical protein A11Q_536 [Pseudobdellovibrio exovorus JSS]